MELPDKNTPVEDLPPNPVAKSPCGYFKMDLVYDRSADKFTFIVYEKRHITHLYFWGRLKREEISWDRRSNPDVVFDVAFKKMVEYSTKRLHSIARSEREKKYREAGY